MECEIRRAAGRLDPRQLRIRPADPAPDTGGRERSARRWLVAGVCANLALLGWFKYANFLIHGMLRLHAPELAIFLPLAISFFTFQQKT